jgi:threonine/homoserine/homoserine lactone efflux protein
LLYLGGRTLLSRPPADAADASSTAPLSPRVAYLSTVGVTITNPATIISFIALFASLGTNYARTPAIAGVMVMGVFGGSALWWLMLSAIVGVARDKLNHAALLWVNRVSGAILLTFGAIALGSGIMELF